MLKYKKGVSSLRNWEQAWNTYDCWPKRRCQLVHPINCANQTEQFIICSLIFCPTKIRTRSNFYFWYYEKLETSCISIRFSCGEIPLYIYLKWKHRGELAYFIQTQKSVYRWLNTGLMWKFSVKVLHTCCSPTKCPRIQNL